jgi:hypothetical protein
MRTVLAILATLAAVPGASAAGSLVFIARDGEVLHGTLEIADTRNVSAVDATTRNSTGIGYRMARAPRGAGGWIAVGKADGSHVPFTIHVPRGTSPGQYFAGIGTKRQIVGIEIDVAGPLLARYVIGAVNAGSAHGRQRLYLHVANTGNVAGRPQGAVSIETRDGKSLRRVRFRMASFLPHTAVDYPLPVASRLPTGTYVAVARLTYQDANGTGTVTSAAAPQFTVSKAPRRFRPQPTATTPVPLPAVRSSSAWPWIGAAAAGAALLLAAAGYLALQLRRRRPVTVTVTPVEPTEAKAAARCAGHHYWQVDWSSAQTDPGGDVTYTHRCRRCGLEVSASDISDAAAKAASLT